MNLRDEHVTRPDSVPRVLRELYNALPRSPRDGHADHIHTGSRHSEAGPTVPIRGELIEILHDLRVRPARNIRRSRRIHRHHEHVVNEGRVSGKHIVIECIAAPYGVEQGLADESEVAVLRVDFEGALFGPNIRGSAGSVLGGEVPERILRGGLCLPAPDVDEVEQTLIVGGGGGSASERPQELPSMPPHTVRNIMPSFRSHLGSRS